MKVVLAESYGYCWGVERAVQMAYEARKSYPDSKLHITNEIIHNPSVNQVRLQCFNQSIDQSINEAAGPVAEVGRAPGCCYVLAAMLALIHSSLHAT